MRLYNAAALRERRKKKQNIKTTGTDRVTHLKYSLLSPSLVADTHSSLQLLNESDPLCLPLAYELLTEALMHEKSRRGDLTELIKYVRVAVVHYPLDAIESHYLNKDEAINEQICRALDGVPIAFGETTLNFSTALNNSIDIKVNPEPSTKKRYSVSMFDEVDVVPQQKPQQKVNIIIVKPNINNIINVPWLSETC